MKLTRRLQIVYSYLKNTDKLADVGCDHGYIAKYALDSGLCKTVVVSDISQPSLDKAIKVLDGYMGKKSFAVCCDGLEKVPSGVSEILIAGMGGEEICKIISNSPFEPQIFVLQPMKNADKVRGLLISKGYGITADTTFFSDSKYYDIIVAEKGVEVLPYSNLELEFGRENITGKNCVFIDFLNDKIKRYQLRLGGSNSTTVQKKINRLVDLKNEINANL